MSEKENHMYQEEQTFKLRFSLEAKFPDEYDGEDDEMVWLKQWETQVKPDIVKSIFQTLERYPDWAARFRNRGMAAMDEIEIVLEKSYSDPSLN
jgi:hypothetical protein